MDFDDPRNELFYQIEDLKQKVDSLKAGTGSKAEFVKYLKTNYSDEGINCDYEAVSMNLVESVVRIVETLQTLPAVNQAPAGQLEKWYECAHVILGASVSELIASLVFSLEQTAKLEATTKDLVEARATAANLSPPTESHGQSTESDLLDKIAVLSNAAAASHDEVRDEKAAPSQP